MTFDVEANRAICEAMIEARRVSAIDLPKVEWEFIVHARTALPAALDEIGRLRLVVDALNARTVTAEEGAEVWSERLVEMTGERDRLLVEIGNLERRLVEQRGQR
jgi:hypothetical protein